jgi:DNA-binding beta-propeller fold protein YncE
VTLPHPGLAYFGRENTEKLTKLRKRTDQHNALQSRTSVSLYPLRESLVLVGSFDNYVSSWTFNHSDGSFQLKSINQVPSSPTWIAASPNANAVFVISESSDFNSSFSGGMGSYSIDPVTGSIQLINQVPSGSALPNFAAFDPLQGHVYVTHSCGNSSLIVVDAFPNYTLSHFPAQIETHEGVSTNGVSCNNTGLFCHVKHVETINLKS